MLPRGTNQNSMGAWSLLPHSMSDFQTHYGLQVQTTASKHFFIAVGPLASFGGAGRRDQGPTAAELPRQHLGGRAGGRDR